MLVSIDWLKEYVDAGLKPEDLADKITMGGVEVEEVVERGGDVMLNLAPTPNRGDCLSIIGVAKDVAALTGKKIKLPKFAPPKGSGKMSKWCEIIVKDKKGAPRYTARVVEGVKVGPSPDWLRRRVESTGTRSINNVVDATNYVLMELGQPVHAFDLRFLKGARLIIDRPKKDLKLKTLDEQEYTFTKDDILNLDAERAIGAAGIMGGKNSGVLDDTTTLVLESAYFDPTTVRRTSKRTGLASESSRRFEKGVDPEGVINGLHRLTELIVKVAGGVPSADWVDIYPKPFSKAKISLTLERVNRILGTDINSKTIVKILESIGCDLRKNANGRFAVTAPLNRPDLTRPIDLIEEVARFYGYEKIKETMPVVRTSSLVRPAAMGAEKAAKEVLANHGFYEAVTYGFSSEEQEGKFGAGAAVRLANPLIADMIYMRTSIVPGLLKALQNNLNRQIEDVRLFEINKIFLDKGKGLPEEKLALAGVMTGVAVPGQWEGKARGVDLFDAKAALSSVFDRLGIGRPEIRPIEGKPFLHPTNSFTLSASGGSYLKSKGESGFCGRLHPTLEREYEFAGPVYIFEIDFGAICRAYIMKEIAYKPISKYPVVVRDVAMLVDSGITHKEMIQSFNKYLNKLVQSVELFDIYSGKGIPEGKKSMAYRLTFGSDERTLEDGEVDQVFAGVVEGVKKEQRAEIR